MNRIKTKVYFVKWVSSVYEALERFFRKSDFECDVDISHEHAKIWIDNSYFGTFMWNINVTFKLLIIIISFNPFIANFREETWL